MLSNTQKRQPPGSRCIEAYLALCSYLFLVVALFPAAGFASPLPQDTLVAEVTVLPRRLAPLPLDLGHNATRTLAERQSAPASTTVASASTAATESNPAYPPNNFFGAGIPSTMLIYVAAAISGGLALSLLVARYFFIKRHYPPTLRAYFVPVKGIHVPFLGLHIDGPPARPPREAPPHYFAAANLRRRRRDRTTRGEGIGEGGVRLGERDEDDAYEGDGRPHDPGNELPMYVMETGLPAYNHVDGEGGERDGNPLPPAIGVTPSSTIASPDSAATSQSARAEQEVDVLPSVQDYENATRQARLTAATSSAVYPPRPRTSRALSSYLTTRDPPAATSASTSSRDPEEEEVDRNSTLTDSSGKTKVDEAKSCDKAVDEEGKDVGEVSMLEHSAVDEEDLGETSVTEASQSGRGRR